MRNAKLVNAKFNEFFFPSVIMAASMSLALVVDSILVGNILGERELAAMNLVMPLSLFQTAISAMFSVGASVCISRAAGSLDTDGANRYFSISALACLGLGLPCSLIGLILPEQIAKLLSGSSGLNTLVESYAQVFLIGSPIAFTLFIFSYLTKTDGQPKLSALAPIVANAINLVLDIVYMRYFGLGLAGCALATITGYAIGSLLFLKYAFSRERNLKLVRLVRKDIKRLYDMFGAGISSMLGQGLMFAKIWIFNMVLASFGGHAGLTAFSVCTACLSLISLFISGGAQTMMPMTGAFFGAKDDTATAYTLKRVFTVTVACCLFSTIIFMLFPEHIMSLFGVKEANVMAVGIEAIRIFSPALPFLAFVFLAMYYAQVIKLVGQSALICALEGFLLIVPLGLALSYLLGGNIGIWLAYPINEITITIFILLSASRIVAKSNGQLYSIMLLKHNRDKITEFSVDLTQNLTLNQDIQNLSQENLRKVLQEALIISAKACQKANCHSADIIITQNQDQKEIAVHILDAGTKIDLILDEVAKEIEAIKQNSINYKLASIVGMNYSVITISNQGV